MWWYHLGWQNRSFLFFLKTALILYISQWKPPGNSIVDLLLAWETSRPKTKCEGTGRDRICKPFKEPRNQFPAWRAGTTNLFVVPRPAILHRQVRSNPWNQFLGLLKRLQIRAQDWELSRRNLSGSLNGVGRRHKMALRSSSRSCVGEGRQVSTSFWGGVIWWRGKLVLADGGGGGEGG